MTKDLFRQVYENNVPASFRKAILHCATQFREVLGMNDQDKKKKKKKKPTSGTKKQNLGQKRSQSKPRAQRSKPSRRQI